MQSIDQIERSLRDAIDSGDATRIATYGQLLDDREADKPAVSLASAALWYAEQGLAVFPLRPGEKVPCKGSRGCKDASSDPARVRAWWRAQPDCNVGVATGHVVDVVDIDGPVGVVSWSRQLRDENGLWLGPPILGRVSTPRPGGHHIYLGADPGRRNRAAMLPGVDARAVGGYVVAPPSVCGQGRYRWVVPLDLHRAAA